VEVEKLMIKIRLNGNPQELEGEVSITELLQFLGLGGMPVVVELDEEAVFQRDYAIWRVKDGARVEVVALAAGG
jgi:thiamine biosynthesis protein ThiS